METAVVLLLMFFGLHFVIFIHEAGHYVAGRHFDLAMPRFVVGFGPKLFGFRRGETSFEWRLIPLFGFVQILGVIGPDDPHIHRAAESELVLLTAQAAEGGASSDRVPETARFQRNGLTDPLRHYYALSWWRQTLVMIAGPAANIVAALMLLLASIVIEFAIPSHVAIDATAVLSSRLAPEIVVAGDRFAIETYIQNGRIALKPETVRSVLRLRAGSFTQMSRDADTLRLIGTTTKVDEQVPMCREMLFKFRLGVTNCLPPAISLGRPAVWASVWSWPEQRLHSALWLLVLQNWVMGVFNLFPIPPLDGGRIVFSLARGARVPLSYVLMFRLTLLGIGLILAWQIAEMMRALLAFVQ